jgi:hypothetical protein
VATVAREHSGVVTGSDGLEAEPARALEQEVELDMAIALNAGIG